MPRQTQILQVFVASPSDVDAEREILDSVVAQLNQSWSKSSGVTFELLKWETNVRPAFANDPQLSINSQIGQDYDVFIGIFWGRLGTPTPRANSGTIEEFENALRRHNVTSGVPEIMLYFKDAPIPPSKIDTQQLQGVLDFKSSFAARGGFYSEFEDLTGFESSLRAHLSAIAQSFSADKNFRGVVNSEHNPSFIANELIMSEEDDYGYIDYIEIHSERQIDMLSAINKINEATVRIGEQVTQHTAEMTSGAKDSKDARRLLKRVADDMDNYANIMANEINRLSNAREVSFNALSNALSLQTFTSAQDHDLSALKDRLDGLIEGSNIAKLGITGMKEATSVLPKISKEINRAKRNVIKELDAFISETESIQTTVFNIIDSIDKIQKSLIK
jgi:hypothetical protein